MRTRRKSRAAPVDFWATEKMRHMAGLFHTGCGASHVKDEDFKKWWRQYGRDFLNQRPPESQQCWGLMMFGEPENLD